MYAVSMLTGRGVFVFVQTFEGRVGKTRTEETTHQKTNAERSHPMKILGG